MTALDELKTIIALEAGDGHWQATENYLTGGVYLFTNRGQVSASTLRRILELVPEVVREAEAGLSQDTRDSIWQEGYDEGVRRRYVSGL